MFERGWLSNEDEKDTAAQVCCLPANDAEEKPGSNRAYAG